MNSREDYQESYNYLGALQKALTVDQITIDFKKLDDKSKGEVIDLLNRFCNRRKSEIWNNILNGVCDPNSYL